MRLGVSSIVAIPCNPPAPPFEGDLGLWPGMADRIPDMTEWQCLRDLFEDAGGFDFGTTEFSTTACWLPWTKSSRPRAHVKVGAVVLTHQSGLRRGQTAEGADPT